MNHDHSVIRDLGRQYAAIAADPIQQKRRELWADHLSLRPTRPLVSAWVGPWDTWLAEILSDANLRCTDPDLRVVERDLRWRLMWASWQADDMVEPWISISPIFTTPWNRLWGVEIAPQHSYLGGAAKYN